jgi:hypothetical protein
VADLQAGRARRLPVFGPTSRALALERDRLRTGHVRAKKKASFCEQKAAKNFFILGRAGFSATGPSEQKFFAPLLIEKAAACLSPAQPITL